MDRSDEITLEKDCRREHPHVLSSDWRADQRSPARPRRAPLDRRRWNPLRGGMHREEVRPKPLTEPQLAVLDSFFAAYPEPAKLLYTKHRALWYAASKRLDQDELNHECRIGAVLAARKFDPTRGFAFSTYAAAWMRNQVQHALAQLRPKEGTVELEWVLHVDAAGNEVRVADLLAAGDESERLRCDRLSVRAQAVVLLVKGIKEQRWRYVLACRMFGQSLQEIADVLGVTKERVRQIEARSRLAVRERLAQLEHAGLV